MSPTVKRRMRQLAAALAVTVVIAGVGAGVVWWKFFKPGEQHFTGPVARFEYGSLDGELVAGLPYAVFMILPRVFPDLVAKYATEGYGPEKPGYGGYGAFGLAWDEGQRLPFGLSIKRLGYDRVTVNCALCHTASYRLSADDEPHFAVGGPAHTLNLQGLLRFLIAASHDARFSSARLLPEINLHFPLDTIDEVTYATVLIPAARTALHLAEQQLGWMKTKPAWGPGRDDAFNLPKFILTQTPWDGTTGNTKFPALWLLGRQKGRLYHSAGEAKTLYAVVATSALGIGSLPGEGFAERNQWLETFISGLQPPPYPGKIDRSLAARGKPIYEVQCARCHAEGGGRTGTAIPLDEIGTDPEHVRAWRQKNADRMNTVVRLLGAEHADVQGTQNGYVAKPLVGLWLLGPYLHNGSIPTLRDLLSHPEQRPTVFFSGYDVVDVDRVGFISAGSEAEKHGFRVDTTLRGNGNGGHDYGTDLSDDDKSALIEFLKAL
jgi:mono/diheme cytochrome c family protein